VNIDIDKLEAMRSKAAKTPWSVAQVGDEFWEVRREPRNTMVDEPLVFDDGSAGGEYGERCREQDRDYIVALANAAPALIAEIKRLRAIEAAARQYYEAASNNVTWSQKVSDWDQFTDALAAKETP
jgi:hypothetical protein